MIAMKPKRNDLSGCIGIGGFFGSIGIGTLVFLLGWFNLLPAHIYGPIFAGCGMMGIASVFGMFVFYGWKLKRLPRLIRQLGNPAKSQTALNQLLDVGERAVPVLIEALSSPAMSMSGTGMESWDGNLARRKAAEGLGQLKAVEAVEPLTETLSDGDVSTRTTAIRSLAEIGDVRAVPALIPLLGDAESVGLAKRTVSDFAADALDKLGQTEVALAFMQTLEGDKTALEVLKGKHRREVIQGLLKAAENRHQSEDTQMNALWALGELRAVEALPKLRLGLKIMAVGGVFGMGSERLKRACEALITHLEAIEAATGTLPRPAEPTVSDVGTLPRPARTPEPDTETLPRPADNQMNVN